MVHGVMEHRFFLQARGLTRGPHSEAAWPQARAPWPPVSHTGLWKHTRPAGRRRILCALNIEQLPSGAWPAPTTACRQQLLASLELMRHLLAKEGQHPAADRCEPLWKVWVETPVKCTSASVQLELSPIRAPWGVLGMQPCYQRCNWKSRDKTMKTTLAWARPAPTS
ncbi:hypothetical protein HaLaN_08103 [Haematococcus lacustris]|uniref:Uncharacterized protein n=1 Tax=Haematococcus lacustris TaxID=44745 RepID=A0A699YYA3_HAELA|nr:hypothetical protein HaLaN_08103 [Haematococcus lacustris]